MTPTNKWWALLVVLALGFWAGGAAAQSDDGGWFDESDTSERPQLKIHGKGKYDPPPPDFRSEPPAPSPTGPEALVEDEPDSDADADVEDAESQQRAVREFSPHLAPYGRWVDDPYYGRVWVPARGVVGAEFRPYVSGGHWELTAGDEWLWVSDYPFGWVTFHYGRWAWLSGGVGWGWVPGYVYAPAWVDFRIGSSGYIGWGPAPPYSVWRGGAFVSLGWYRPIPYIFCPTTYVFSTRLPRYVVYDRYRVRSIAAETYRYRPRYVAGSAGSRAVRVRSPSPREAYIPSRYVPSRRVIAQPRGGYVAARYRDPGGSADVRQRESRRLDAGGRGSVDRGHVDRGHVDRGAVDRGRVNRSGGYAPSRRRAAPDESRQRSVDRSVDRSGDVRRETPSRSRFDATNMAPSRRIQGSPGGSTPARGSARQGWASPPTEIRRDGGSSERRDAPPARARDDGARSRSSERSSGAAERRSDNRRPSAAPARSSRSGGARSGGASQQRSRSSGRDGR